MLEERGFSTVAIASVRAQAEKTRPPRALWTTSQLGRPLGEPENASFQRRVLLAALGLLERTDGQGILEDFAEDPPVWRAAQTRFGRTQVGLIFQAPAAWPGFATRFLAVELPAVPELDTPALALRMLCDDIKAFYGEAAQAEGPAPSAHQIDAWFWRQTVAGTLLIALREVAMASENNALKTVGGRFFVP